MEVVLLVVAVIGIAMVALPRIKRRRRVAARPVAVAAPAVTWSADDDWDDDLAWEDDLGWEGEEKQPVAAAATSERELIARASGVAAPSTNWRDDDWASEPAPRSWSRPAAAVAAQRRRVHPVALVAIYAAAGIGVIVLASTVLLGGAESAPPAPVKQVVAAPQATPAVVATPVVDQSAAQAAKVAEQNAHTAFVKERARAMEAERRDLAAAHKKQAAAARRKNAAHHAPVAVTPQPTPVYTAPTQTYHAPASSGASHGGGGCEFCIG